MTDVDLYKLTKAVTDMNRSLIKMTKALESINRTLVVGKILDQHLDFQTDKEESNETQV